MAAINECMIARSHSLPKGFQGTLIHMVTTQTKD
jgi:hypothetical protein